MSEKILFTTGLEPRAYPTELPGPPTPFHESSSSYFMFIYCNSHFLYSEEHACTNINVKIHKWVHADA